MKTDVRTHSYGSKLYKFSFMNTVVDKWNKRSSYIAEENTIDWFKQRSKNFMDEEGSRYKINSQEVLRVGCPATYSLIVSLCIFVLKFNFQPFLVCFYILHNCQSKVFECHHWLTANCEIQSPPSVPSATYCIKKTFVKVQYSVYRGSNKVFPLFCVVLEMSYMPQVLTFGHMNLLQYCVPSYAS